MNLCKCIQVWLFIVLSGGRIFQSHAQAVGEVHDLAGRNAILAIGVSNYKFDVGSPLQYSSNDAILLTDAFKTYGVGQFEEALLTDERASLKGIHDAIETFSRRPRFNTFIFYFSGHAKIDELTGSLYLIPHDGDSSSLAATAINANVFVERLKALAPANLILIIDACHAGAINGRSVSEKLASGSDVSRFLDGVHERSNQQIITFASAASGELATEDTSVKQSIFSSVLVEGLSGRADSNYGNDDGKVTASELELYVRTHVVSRARTLNRVQLPRVNLGDDPDFVISNRLVGPRPQSYALSLSSQNNFEPMVRRASDKDPILALQLQYTISQRMGTASEMGSLDYKLREAYERARAKHVGSLDSVSDDSPLIDATVSPSGRLALACSLKGDFLLYSLTSFKKTGQLGNIILGREGTIDRCSIQFSGDERFAAVGVSIGDATATVIVSVEPFLIKRQFSPTELVTMVKAGLVVSTGRKLSILHLSSFELIAEWSLKFSPVHIAGSSTADLLLATDSQQIQMLSIDSSESKPPVRDHLRMSIGESSQYELKKCSIQGDLAICPAYSGIVGFSLEGMRQDIIAECPGASVRQFFPSSKLQGGVHWSGLYNCTTTPRVVKLMSRVLFSNYEIPEPAMGGRLLSDGTVVIISERGKVYRASRILYGECCKLRVPEKEVPFLVYAGDREFSIVLTRADHKYRLHRFGGLNAIGFDEFDFPKPPRSIGISPDGMRSVVAGEDWLMVVQEKASSTVQKHSLIPGCGSPFSFDSQGENLICWSRQRSKLERYVITGNAVLSGHTSIEGVLSEVQWADDSVRVLSLLAGGRMVGFAKFDKSLSTQRFTSRCRAVGLDESATARLIGRSDKFVVIHERNRLLIKMGLNCTDVAAIELIQRVSSLANASNSDKFIAVGREIELKSISGSYGRELYELHTPALPSQMSLSPDGSGVGLIVLGDALRISLTHQGLLDVVRKLLSGVPQRPECKLALGEGCIIVD